MEHYVLFGICICICITTLFVIIALDLTEALRYLYLYSQWCQVQLSYIPVVQYYFLCTRESVLGAIAIVLGGFMAQLSIDRHRLGWSPTSRSTASSFLSTDLLLAAANCATAALYWAHLGVIWGCNGGLAAVSFGSFSPSSDIQPSSRLIK